MFLTWLTGMKNAKKKNRFLHTQNRGNPCSALGIQPKPGLFTVVERKFEPFEAYLFLHCLLFTTVYPGHGSRNETKMVALVLFFSFLFFCTNFYFLLLQMICLDKANNDSCGVNHAFILRPPSSKSTVQCAWKIVPLREAN